MYSIENYKDNVRFNKQYEEIRKFLQIIADNGYNEHFHWGRFDWMMAHSYLDVEMLSRIALFRKMKNYFFMSGKVQEQLSSDKMSAELTASRNASATTGSKCVPDSSLMIRSAASCGIALL